MIDENTRCYRHPDRPAATGCQRCDRPVCAEDMRSASVGFHCPECVKESGQRVYTPQNFAFEPTVTIAIIAVNVIAFLAQRGSDGSVTRGGLLFGPAVEGGELYRIVTSAFLHANFIHIGFNMYLLWILGRPLEQAFGRVKYLLLYATALFGGSAAVTLFNFNQPTLGASGSVLGLAGAMGAVYFARGYDVRQSPAFTLVLLNLGIPLIIPGISFWGHLGGIIGGAVAALILVYLPERTSVNKGAVIPLMVAAMATFAVLTVAGAQIGGI